MKKYVEASGLKIDNELYSFVNNEVIPGTTVEANAFWQGFADIVAELKPKNEALLHTRKTLQQQIDQWHTTNKDAFSTDDYNHFLQQINYIEPEVPDFEVTTENVDKEIAQQPGPQLVVPLSNARYVLNAANARWGSLYDALYGTDVISEDGGAAVTSAYNPERGKKVISYAKQFLDEILPLADGSHQEAVRYAIKEQALQITLEDKKVTELKDPAAFIGYSGEESEPASILFQNHQLHIELQIDEEHPIGKTDSARVKDVLIESAITTIMDCEDSVAAVDAEDKVEVYRNWLGLMKGNLTTSFQKGEKSVTRELNPDRTYTSPAGTSFSLPGRSHMLIRNVGHLMTTPAVLDANSEEVPEGIVDAAVTSLIASHDLLRNGRYTNSQEGSVYIVKPKMHGSEEVAFSNQLFSRVEDLLQLERNTLKIGVMDEERRTSLNLKACIQEVKERIIFINTGFLDRTGDEIHTSMKIGPMIRKGEMKTSTWLDAYEKANVTKGLASGLQGHAQIGKGMWPMPDRMKAMLEQKMGQLYAGANTAWVPSPTAATLHALHYHQIDVVEVQNNLMKQSEDLENNMLHIPAAQQPDWSEEEIQLELDNNAQGILGYVVRWVDMGIGCSKVPDINDTGLMEDRATLRISSQHIANWLKHDICTEEQVLATMKRMAKVVDQQNEGAVGYEPMSSNYEESIAFQAACDLVFEGTAQPNGYTEPILHKRRMEKKNKASVQQP
ncbi:malate synthase G [Salsuginibacillus kocurii]|uniref:malate synthase G n=1 Tax=Salsuginibacillus kocurii TaxID=427078 RepID=UPI000370555D|nr:malate synthase G [Salsuginibacillus kocurii]